MVDPDLLVRIDWAGGSTFPPRRSNVHACMSLNKSGVSGLACSAIDESLLTSLFTFFLISIRLNS